MRFSRALAPVLLLVAAACSSQTRYCTFGQEQQTQTVDPLSSTQPVSPDAVPESQRSLITFLGDSLTEGYGLVLQQAFPALIQDMFVADGYGEIVTVNAGISGDTTAGGLRRVEGLLEPNLRILVVSLGANDALRGLSVNQTHDNLAGIIDAALAGNVTVVLVGMEAPTNLGEDYRNAFRDSFIRLSQEYRGRITYLPFLLEGVAGLPEMNQADGIHPNAAGARVIADMLYPKLRNLIDGLTVGRS